MGITKALLLALFVQVGFAWADAPAPAPVPAPAPAAAAPSLLIWCRVVVFKPGEIVVLSDVELDTLSQDPADYIFDTALSDKQTLSVAVRKINISPVAYPKDRFNVMVKLDGQPYMRLGHADLDLYIDIFLNGQRHALHCMPPIE